MSDFSFMFVILGMIGSLAVTPMDVVKTRLQVLRNAQGEAAYSGIVDCVQKTYTNEGIMAFYKGAVPRMIVIAPLFGIAQMVYFLGVAEWMIGWEVWQDGAQATNSFPSHGKGWVGQAREEMGCCNETKSNKSIQRYLLSLHEKVNVNGSEISNKLLNKKILAIQSDRILYII